MTKQLRIETIKKIIKTTFGLFVFSFGEYLTIMGNIGLTPWDSLSMGISYYVPFTFGQVHVASAIVIIFIDLAMKEKIGIGTVLDALLVGTFVDMWTSVIPFKGTTAVIPGIALVIAGLFIMAIGQVFYMSGGLSCGPRDTLLVAVGKRLSKLPIGLVDILMKIALVLISFVIGGPIGFGTLLAMLGMGTCMQIVYGLFKFDPRNIEQESIITSIEKLM